MTMRSAPLPVIELEHVSVLPDGRLAEWEAVGSGDEPLVWVEGGPGLPAHLARADVVPVLDRFRCHLVNAPGSGRSTAPRREEGYGLEATVAFLEDWREAVGLGPVTLMGHSWGGLVAPAWAAIHPASVRRLIVISGYPGFGAVDEAAATAERERALDRLRTEPWFDAAWRCWEAGARPGRTEQDIADRFWTYLPFYFAHPEDPVAVAHIERIGREQRWHMPANEAWVGWRAAMDWRPLLARVRCPTLVVAGEHDWICGPAWNRPLAAAIDGARYAEIAGVGHLPQYEAPATLRAVIDEWLAGLDGEAAAPGGTRPV
ncbi:MAG TPA: alpha/beta hydrolase [Candidatus Limnocylindrales bacterium]|nr:alpha/beta hydrolase [Candidatus Limnocylindrales bacterium]